MTIFALIGATALYLLFAWLISAASASWLSDRKGYGERVGLTFGLLLSVIGLLIVILLPARPNSKWKLDGPLPWSGRVRPEPPPSGSEIGSGDPPD
ncbi:MAG TPA: hypothetical protein VIL82_02080 [Solirubrobacteraceae bacterium]|jgi:hypothetical protein